MTSTHPQVAHPHHVLAEQRAYVASGRHRFVRWNDRILEWVTDHVLASIGLFDTALVVPLLTLPMSNSIKLILGVVSGSWIQWWALPALQRSSNKVQASQEAKADTDHRTLVYLAQIQDEQLEILKRLDPESKEIA